MHKIYLVGAGSGDPELLTLKGQRLLASADVVLYDRLVNPLLLYHTKPSAQLIYVGKKREQHSQTQEDIHQLMIKYYHEGCNVVRLQGGDPSVYGRVAEEMDSLDRAQIPYEVVPGITSAFSASIYAGFAVTKRQVAEKVFLMTPTAVLKTLEEEPLADIIDSGTIVVYMGMKALVQLLQTLAKQHIDPKTAIAVVQWGTFGRQKKAVGTLATILDQVKQAHIEAPALIFLGADISMVPEKSWFEKLPYFGTQYCYVSDTIDDLENVYHWISQGADVYPIFVGEAHDARFDSIHRRYLSEFPDYLQHIYYANPSIEKTYASYIRAYISETGE